MAEEENEAANPEEPAEAGEAAEGAAAPADDSDIDDIANNVAANGAGGSDSTGGDGTPEGELEAAVVAVIARLKELGIPPTPKHFEEFLLMQLSEIDEEVRDEIFTEIFIPNESNNIRINFENKVTGGMDYLKDILKIVAVIYKNMNVISQIAQKRSEECENTNDKAVVQNILSSLQQDIHSLTKVTNKQMNQIKTLYQKIVVNTTSIEKSTIYDRSMNVYNKQYFTDKSLEFQELVKNNRMHATLVFMKLSKKNIIEIKKQERLKTILKNIATLIKSIKKQNDIVSYYGNGVFAIILKDCDLPKAEEMVKTILRNTSRTSFFLNDKEITLDVKFGLTNMTKDELIDNINKGMKALNKADSEKSSYIVLETEVEADAGTPIDAPAGEGADAEAPAPAEGAEAAPPAEGEAAPAEGEAPPAEGEKPAEG